MPDNIVEALVGEAFNRLDPNAQRVMQALAVYNRPVTPAAVDYLLQPFAASVDSAPVLNRLVTMQFVRRESGRYYLHPVDCDYAFKQVTRGERTDYLKSPALFTQFTLLIRGADYFQHIRKQQELWKTINDLEPQLAEFDLRCLGEDYEGAISLLLEFDYEYLLVWGYYLLMIELHERLREKITDTRLSERSSGRRGHGYFGIGKYDKAKACYEDALSIAVQSGNRAGEGMWLGNLGHCYFEIGQTTRAIEFHRQALAIAQEIGYRRGEEISLGNLGECFIQIGRTEQAIECFSKCLPIDLEVGDRSGEGIDYGRLGWCYADTGKTTEAISNYIRALSIARELGDRLNEGIELNNLSVVLIDEGHYSEAIQNALECIRVWSEIASPRSYGNDSLALAHLYCNELSAARLAAENARKYDEPINNHNVAALFGIIALRQNDVTAAQEAFIAAIQHADKILALTPEFYDALDAKGVALCGLGLCSVSTNAETAQRKRMNDAIATFRAARKINKDKGIVARVLRLIDALALAHPNGAELLAEARKAASGD